jgi:hypothetical protein
MWKGLFLFFYRHSFLCCVLFRYTAAYRVLFPNGVFLDNESPYLEEIRLIRRAIRFPDFQLSEADMGIVLSQLIQSPDVGFSEAQEVCAFLNQKYSNELHYMYRRTVIELQLDEFEKKRNG